MARYLDQFLSIVPSIQGRQILELLNSAKDIGAIRTLEEYQVKLQELTDVLKSTDPQPTFKIFQAIVGKPITSEAFNLMLTTMLNDLETAFKEIQNVAEVLAIHKTLINENILKNLKSAINDLENKILIQEFLNSDRNGFTLAQFNTFRQGGSMSTKRSDTVAGNVFVDNQTGMPLDATYDAIIDLVGEKLIMAPKRTQYLTLRDIALVIDAETRITELDVAFPGSNIRNAIDGQTGTYWIHPILLAGPDREGVVIKIEVILQGYQDVNFIELEPATLAGFILEEIQYTDVNGENKILPIDPTTINRQSRLDFNAITTKKFIFKFRQNSYQWVQYSYNQNSRIWERAIAEDAITLDDIDKTIMNDELLNILNSEELRSLNDITAPNAYQNVNMVEYLMGFDNIFIGFTEYQNRSIFVSSVLEGNQVGILGLQAQENRLINIFDLPVSSFEYNIFKQNFASDGTLVDSEECPILPATITTILHERLIFNENTAISNDTGTLRFYPDASPLVYKDFNITPLVEGAGFDYEIINNSGLTPPNMKIRLVDPNPTSIYTVSYTPIYSGVTVGSEVWLNKQRTMKLNRGNMITFTNDRPNATVATSKVYLTILMRNNSTNDTETPSLDQYRLLLGTIDIQRFIE